LTISARYSCEIFLNVGLGASIDNMQDSKALRKKTVEVNSTRAYIKILRLLAEASEDSTLEAFHQNN
jgi:hypothetical protein